MYQNNNFKKWLKKELDKPSGYKYYNPNDNSIRARASRGLLREIIWQYKDYPKSLWYDIKCFRGFDTSIGYFVMLPLKLILSPILPIFWGYFSYREAIKYYKEEYKKYSNKKEGD